MAKKTYAVGDKVLFTRFGREYKGIITKEYTTPGQWCVRAEDKTHYPAVTVDDPTSYTNIISHVK